MPNDDRLRALLSDLGKATLRGVRRCPKCGTFNGTRGISCKNKACDVVFKVAGEKRKLSTEACKLHTGTTNLQIFSVRVRDKGPDYRGFVQLPLLIPSLDGDQTLSNASALITESASQCFVESCMRTIEQDKSEGIALPTCHHIKAALRCYAEAQPLDLKNSVLASLNVSNETKQAIWLLATETTGPLVQRVSKTIMAVKCKTNPKHPLGYLHFSFFPCKENKFFCSCKAFRGQVKGADKEDGTFKRCVHFYACICAFASDPKLADEFLYFINLDKILHPHSSVVLQSTRQARDQNLKDTLPAARSDEAEVDEVEHHPQRHLMTFLANNGDHDDPCSVEVEVLPEEAALLEATGITVNEDGHITQVMSMHNLEVLPDQIEVQMQTGETDPLHFPEVGHSILTEQDTSLEQLLGLKRKREDPIAQASSALLTLQDGGSSSTSAPTRKPGVKRQHGSIGSLAVKHDPPDENATHVSFLDWLGSVAERINQAMHYQFDGKPDPLIFHISHAFFECLRERISCGGKKKRLPNFTRAFVRKDKLPMGTFTKYTWHITNVIQVKQIFDTPKMPLEVTQSFIQRRDGTFELFEQPQDKSEMYRKLEGQPLIKPLELKTFLKVGNMSPGQTTPTPFVIEWIPDLLPRSHIGELRVEFEYGHQRNGLFEKRDGSLNNALISSSEKPYVAIPSLARQRQNSGLAKVARKEASTQSSSSAARTTLVTSDGNLLTIP
ncbi:uncharacterized protein C2orf42 [Hetaerina americana]|uniref:uncharacterized protein C2orf42 n=1 Tax=Hetaerina americana TaxID=62018 RepID=UPI003A7F2339